MRIDKVSDPVYAPNSKGGPKADPERYPEAATWSAGGEFVRAAYTKRKDDDDFGQAGTLVRKVMDDAQRDRLVSNVVGHLKNGVSEPVLKRAFEYWRNIDKEIGDLSGGEKQRVALVSALLLDRDIFLLDEVTSALDPASKRKVIDHLRSRTKATMLFVAHDAESFPFADSVIEMQGGTA
jgi:ABC-type Mn2+/Zn2+ transport system ATPase subunit